jgi:hypothetical protein
MCYYVQQLWGHIHEALATLLPRKSFVRQPVNNRVYAVGTINCMVAKLRELCEYGVWLLSFAKSCIYYIVWHDLHLINGQFV